LGRIYNCQIVIEKKLNIKLIIPAIVMAGMFFSSLFSSCVNYLDEVRTVTATDSTPDEVVNTMHTLYSDSGIVNFEIIASRMEKYTDQNLTVFKNGFEVNFFKGKD